MRTAALPIFRATIRSTRTSLRSALGGGWVVSGMLVLGAAIALGLNVVVFRTLHQMAGALVEPSPSLPQAQREGLLANMLSSVMLLGAIIAVVFGTLIPHRSNVTLIARVAGASRFAIGMSDMLAQYLVAVATILSTQAGIVAFVSLAMPAPIVTGSAIASAALTFAALALSLKAVLRLVMQLIGLGDELSNLASLLFALTSVLILLGDLLMSAFDGRMSCIRRVLDVLWLGETVPRTAWALLAAWPIMILTLIGSIVLGAWGSNRVAFAHTRALLPSGQAGSPGRIVAFAKRELLLAVRQPVSQISYICLLLLIAAMVVAARVDWLPLGPSSYLFAFLCALGGELAYGRTQAFHWIYRSASYPVRVILLVKFGAILAVQASVLILSLAAASPIGAVASLLPRVVLLFVSLSAITFFCGVVVPISEAAPYSMIGTTILVLGLDIGLVLVDSTIGDAHLAAVPLHLCVIVAGLWGAIAIADRRAS